MKKAHVQLAETDRSALETLLSSGILPVRVYKRATGLLALDRGETLAAVAALLGVTNETVANWRDQYKAAGLAFLQDKPRSGRPVQIDSGQRAQITALASSEAPAGHGQWSLRLLREKAVELGFCERISHTSVGKILKKTD
jgi:putative transposase